MVFDIPKECARGLAADCASIEQAVTSVEALGSDHADEHRQSESCELHLDVLRA